jgi:hypothetical protein
MKAGTRTRRRRAERYLEGQRERGRLEFEEAGEAIDAIIGLTIGGQQVGRLLGVLPEVRRTPLLPRASVNRGVEQAEDVAASPAAVSKS